MATKIGRPARLARTIAKNHGVDGLLRLLELFNKGISGEDIAAEFKVTRQRVHQWRHILGVTKKLYVVDTGVMDLVKTLATP